MTLLNRTLAQLIHMAQMDKAYAWWSAKRYAELYPQELADLPTQLTSEMKRLQSLTDCAKATETPES